jgi:hypothetical protein
MHDKSTIKSVTHQKPTESDLISKAFHQKLINNETI